MLVVSWCGAQPVEIDLSGRALVVNDVSEIPVGMFGVHATRLTPEQQQEWGVESVRVIRQSPTTQPVLPGEGPAREFPNIAFVLDCFYDRYQPALPLTTTDWESRLIGLARGYAESARGVPAFVEFWNEPYLNWSVRPGVNYDGRHYDETRAVEGGPVMLRGSDEPIQHLAWRRGLRAVDERGQTSYLAWGYMPRDATPGSTYDFRGTTMRVEEAWLVRDVSQHSFYAGQYNLGLYLRMLVPFARALKETNPDVQLVAGWGFHLYQDGWRAWHEIHRPTIDASIRWIDGYNEHHYGGDTRNVACSYEVAVAYAQTAHGKRIRMYNTEAGGALDPQRPDTTQTNANAIANPVARARGAATYMLRDVIYLLAKMPDKAAARYAHEAHANGGDEWAFKLLKPLRGMLMEIETNQSDLWAVASLREDELCIVLFNDNPAERELRLELTAPRGSVFLGATSARIEPIEASLAFREQRKEIAGPVGVLLDRVSGKSAVRYVLKLDAIPNPQTVARSQHFARELLQRAEPGQTMALTLSSPDEARARLEGARLRLLLPAGVRGDATIEFNGERVDVGSATHVVDVAVNPALLRASNTLQIRAGNRPVPMESASLFLITERRD